MKKRRATSLGGAPGLLFRPSAPCAAGLTKFVAACWTDTRLSSPRLGSTERHLVETVASELVGKLLHYSTAQLRQTAIGDSSPTAPSSLPGNDISWTSDHDDAGSPVGTTGPRLGSARVLGAALPVMTVHDRPAWLAEVARMAVVPVPWPTMAFATLAIGVPFLIGVLGGELVPAVLVSVGAIVALMVDRAGPYPLRVRRLATVGVGGALGFVIGIAINGHGWVAVGVLAVVATISAVLSSVNAIWSSTGLWLLGGAVLATGPLGMIKPWWHTPLWVLVGVGWWLLLMLPGWLRHPRAPEQRYVAAVYTALAADLRADPNDAVGPSRQGLAAALNSAYADVLNQRAAESGPSEHLRGLVTLLGRARLIGDTLAALHYAKEQPPPEAATQAQAIAEAVLKNRGNVTPVEPPTPVSPQMVAVYDLLNQAADVVSGRWLSPDAFRETGWSRQRPNPGVVAQRVRHALTSTFTIRLTLCVGVAAIFSETLPLQRSYWVVLAVAVVMKPDYGSVFARTLQYAAGTVIGALVAALILAARPSDAALLAPMIALAALGALRPEPQLWGVLRLLHPAGDTPCRAGQSRGLASRRGAVTRRSARLRRRPLARLPAVAVQLARRPARSDRRNDGGDRPLPRRGLGSKPARGGGARPRPRPYGPLRSAHRVPADPGGTAAVSRRHGGVVPGGRGVGPTARRDHRNHRGKRRARSVGRRGPAVQRTLEATCLRRSFRVSIPDRSRAAPSALNGARQ